MTLPYINQPTGTIFDTLEFPYGINEDTILIEPLISGNSIFCQMIDKFKLRNVLINHTDPNVAHVYHQIQNNIFEVLADYEELMRIYNSGNSILRTKLYTGIVNELKNPEICPVLKAVYLIYEHTINTNVKYDRSTLIELYKKLKNVHISNLKPMDMILNESNILYYISTTKEENAAFAAYSLNGEFLKIVTDMNQKLLIYDGDKNY